MDRRLNSLIPIFLTALILVASVGCEKDNYSLVPEQNYEPKTAVGKAFLENSDIVAGVFSDSSFVVTEGVEETDIHFLKMNGLTTHAYVLKIDLSTPGLQIKVGMPYDNNESENFTKQTLTEIAAYTDKPNHRVVGMINGDFWDIGNMDLRGPLHRNGMILKDYFIPKASLPQQALSFVAITKNNEPLIREKEVYPTVKDELKEVTGGGAIVVREGQIASLPADWTQVDPRTVWGYTADNIVYFMVVDGRSSLYSNGMSYDELGSVMQALGCQYAVNLDGGGSSQMMIKRYDADVFQIRNRPSDGSERAVVNTWMVVVDEP